VRLAVAAAILIPERTVAAVVLVLPAVTIIIIIIVVVVPATFVLVKLLVGALNDLIKLAAIEPYAATLRAVINFNALAIGDGQEYVAFWTIHGVVWWFLKIQGTQACLDPLIKTGLLNISDFTKQLLVPVVLNPVHV
jgi:hypothetical protein